MDHIINSSSGDLYIDLNTRTVYLKFSGQVILEEYQMILLKAEQMIHEKGLTSIIDDRADVFDYPADCRVWYKHEFLTENFVNIVDKLDKIALIKSKIPSGKIQTDALEKTINIAATQNSNTLFSSFATIEEAEQWIADQFMAAG